MEGVCVLTADLLIKWVSVKFCPHVEPSLGASSELPWTPSETPLPPHTHPQMTVGGRGGSSDAGWWVLADYGLHKAQAS